jgi:type I restriction enzyme S subunit
MVEWKELKEVFDTRNGYTPSTSNETFWEGGNIPWFKMEDLRNNGGILNDSYLHITEKAIKGKGLFKANSILLATSATIGEHALIEVEHLSNQRFTNFYPKKEYEQIINMRYAYYYMFIIDEWCKQHVNQGGFASVDMSGLYKHPFPIPSISEQERIVDILDTFTSAIDNLKQQIAQRRKQYEYYRDQLLDLEGKEGVEMKSCGEVCEVTDYVANGSFATLRENVSYRQEPDYAVLVRTIDLSNNFDGDKVYIDDKAYKFLSKSSLFGGEIIINNIGAGVGQTFRCPYLKEKMSLGPNSILVRTPNNDFYYYWFNSICGQNAMMKVVTPGAMPKFNKTGFKTITIPLPSLSDQQRIVSILDTFEASIQNLEAQLSQREKQYEYYRNKLLTFE